MTEVAKERSEIVFDTLRHHGTGYYLLIISLLAILGWGLYAYYVQLTTGMGVTGMRNLVSWGLYIVNFVFFIGISHAGTLISAILRVTNTGWRRPITRISESITVMAILVALVFPMIDLGRPDRMVNPVIYARVQSPLSWDFYAIGTYLIGSTIFLYLALIPDIAYCRDRLDRASRIRKWIYNTLSLGWTGSRFEIERLAKGMKIMSVLIIPIAVSVHTVVSWDFAMTLRTGWNTTIFGPYFVAGAIFSGIATIILALAFFTKFYHLEGYITKKHYDSLGKMLLALDIAMIYLAINEFLVPGYKFLQQSNLEGQLMSALFWGQYAPFFWFQMIGGLIVPAFILAVPRTRTLMGYLVASLLIDIGMWMERYNIIVPTLAVPQMNYPWGTYTPSWVEISITASSFAGFALIFILFTRIFPAVSIWETEEAEHPEAKSPIVTSRVVDTSEQSQSRKGASPSTARRDFLRMAAFALSGLAVGLVSPRLTSTIARNAPQSGVSSSERQKLSLMSLGRSTSLADAERMVGFPVATPSKLPHGSNLRDVRVVDAGRLVSLFYENPSLSPISIYQEEVAIAILMAPGPYGPPRQLPIGFLRVEVDGKEGFAREPILGGLKGEAEPGQMQWWGDGVRYSIFANLSVDELRKIAVGMDGGRRV